MKALIALLLIITLTNCTTIEIRPDGYIKYDGIRKATIATPNGTLIVTGEVLLDQKSIQAIAPIVSASHDKE